ncbi:hypothetical protein A0H81_08144 [Grifola frondosa]|uniref:Uncharacterized protein n=1 Tax=Grifola frondosa TaxID=5627 RepID=A0A1C7M4F9_GRIFR|nr:hypothetical protein A0H81_08144 [Grifola frondosa]
MRPLARSDFIFPQTQSRKVSKIVTSLHCLLEAEPCQRLETTYIKRGFEKDAQPMTGVNRAPAQWTAWDAETDTTLM